MVLRIELSSEVCDRIASVDGLMNNADHATLKINDTLTYMADKYVVSASRHMDISGMVICDCGAGFGWAAFAFLLLGAGKAIVVEPHEKKLAAAKKIADILGLSDRCQFLSCPLQDINLPDRSVDIFLSVETLEHVGRDNIGPSIANIERLTRKMIILTAPNQLSPLVSHDARVPFSHWLPIRLRPLYCRLFGVSHATHHHFPGPWHLKQLYPRFKPSSKVLMFTSFREWVDHYPVYSPYNGGIWKETPPVWLKAYLKISSLLLGKRAYWICPNLASVWVADR